MVEKVAIVGAGLMGQWHCHFVKSLGARIDAVVDSDETRARALAEKFSCANVFRSTPEMLAKSGASVVHICTPTGSHAGLIRESLDAGRHVLVEKPLADGVAVTRDLLNYAHEKRLLLNPIHQFAFQHGFQELLDRRPELGHPSRISFMTCSAGGENKSPELRREIMLEILPHPLSLLAKLFPNSIDSVRFQTIRFTDDELELASDSDGTALSIVINLRGRPTRNEFTFIADRGSAYLDLFHGYAVFERGEVSRSAKILKPLKFGAGVLFKSGTNLARRAAASEPAYPGLKELISQFYESIRTNQPAPISDCEILAAASTIESVRNHHGAATVFRSSD